MRAEISACVRYNQKRARKSSKRAKLRIVTPYFPKLRAFKTLHPHKQYVFFEFLVENKEKKGYRTQQEIKISPGIPLL